MGNGGGCIEDIPLGSDKSSLPRHSQRCAPRLLGDMNSPPNSRSDIVVIVVGMRHGASPRPGQIDILYGTAEAESEVDVQNCLA